MSSKRSPVLNIPERYRSGFAVVIRMADASFEQLSSALKRAPSFADSKALSAWVAPEAPSTSAQDVGQVVDALTSLYRVRLQLEITPERIARDITSTLRDDSDPELTITDENFKLVSARLANLLGMESLNVIQTKAQELKGEYEHEFCDVRIFTDLRPVFRSNVADTPESMLLVHTLKLGYHDAHEGRHREFFVSLDGSDLATLKAAIERAEIKAKSVTSRLREAGLKLIDLA